MFIPRIFRPSGISKPKARGRRTQSERLFQLEPLENRTPLSGGLDIGFAAALISKPPQFGLADVSLSPPIDLTIQGAIALNSPTLAGSGGLFGGSLQSTLPAATGDSLPPSPGTVEQVASIAVDGQIMAPLFSPPQPTAALESGTSPTWFGSECPGREHSPSLVPPLWPAMTMVLDLSERISLTVSRDSQYSVPALDPTSVQHDLLGDPRRERFSSNRTTPTTMGFNPAASAARLWFSDLVQREAATVSSRS